MTGFWLLMGHMIGDYLIQNDWMASNKTNAMAGPPPEYDADAVLSDNEVIASMGAWSKRYINEFKGHLACTAHCLLYTFAVWACSFWWMPSWGLVACFVIHWPLDRFRLAGRWMRNVSGQHAFATGPFSPWSIIVVDNIFHLLTLGVIAALAGVPL